MDFHLSAPDLLELKKIQRNVVGTPSYVKVTCVLMFGQALSVQVIISDNARYYRNKELTQWVNGTRIRQLFLPPYSPNLNLIERLWKFLRKKVINTGFYRTKEIFREAVRIFFENIQQYKVELKSLLTLNFRLANSQSISF